MWQQSFRVLEESGGPAAKTTNIATSMLIDTISLLELHMTEAKARKLLQPSSISQIMHKRPNISASSQAEAMNPNALPMP